MPREPVGLVSRSLGPLAGHVQRAIRRWALAVVIPSVGFGAEDLKDTEDEPIAVNALAPVDLEVL